MTDITDDDYKLIAELRAATKPLLTAKYDTDYNLLRWLKATSYDTNQSLISLTRHLKIRKLANLDKIQNIVKPDIFAQKYIPIGLLGDAGKSNKLVVIECAGKCDPNGLLKCAQRFKFLEQRYLLMENIWEKMIEQERLTNERSGVIYIVDLDGLVMDTCLISIVTGQYKILWDRIGDNYPEWLHKFFVVNVPTFMSVLWAALSPLLPEQTREKIIITDENWREQLLEFIHPDHLPVHWGGKMVDETGDPMCRSKLVVPSEKIPPELYWKPEPGDPSLDKMQSITVPAGSYTLVSYYILDPGTIVKFYLYGEQEFTLAILYGEDPKSLDLDRMEEFFPNAEYPGMITIDSWQIAVDQAGMYHFKFGNEKAWWYSVEVKYQLEFFGKEGKRVTAIPVNTNNAT